MSKLKIKILLILSTVFLSATPLFIANDVHAQSLEVCGGIGNTQYVAYTLIPEGTKKLYARSYRIEDTGKARLYFQTMDIEGQGECILIGEFNISNDKWTSVGVFTTELTGGAGSLILEVERNDYSEAGASAPSVVMTGETPPCTIQEKCEVLFEGSAYELFPRKLSSSIDNLKVGHLLPIEQDDVKEVIYSIDGIQAYKTKTIENFNLNYVPGGEYKLERTVILSSGQTLSDVKVVYNGQLGSLENEISAIYNRYQRLINYILITIGVIVVWYVLNYVVQVYQNKKRWKMHHIAGYHKQKVGLTGPLPEQKLQSTPTEFAIRNRKKIAVFCIVFTVFYVGYGSVLTVFRVEGESMYPTLNNDSKKILFTLPTTIGGITNTVFVPNRGSVVVINRTESNPFQPSSPLYNSYVVKRVIATPGERVVVKDGEITVFNEEYRSGFVPDDIYNWVTDRTGSEMFNFDITLKENELFVVGDNRDESVDSRMYGPVKTRDVVGRVL